MPRRLNSFEYRNTIGDLLGLNVAGWNPAANFPPEDRVGGFDNNSAAQVTSGMLLDHYLAAAELAPIEKLVTAKLSAGMKPLDALQLGCQTILCSPAFLHLHEGTGKLDDYALASRLSYFFWSSMPDQTLIQLAAAGTLHEPATLGAQVDRMLADPKSHRGEPEPPALRPPTEVRYFPGFGKGTKYEKSGKEEAARRSRP